MRGSTLVALGLVATWIVVWGRPTPVELVLGIVSALIVARFLRNLYDSEVSGWAIVRGTPRFLVFLAAFGKDLVLSSFDVAYRTLRPSTIAPAIVEVPLRAEADGAVALVANRITLTPGTLSADYDADRGVLKVHSITAARDPRSLREAVRDLDRTARRIWGETT